MFEWLRNLGKPNKETYPTWADIPPLDNNVVKFPEPKLVPPMPPIPPNPEKDEARIFYRFGMTDSNRIAFSMGYGEITMNKQGCQQMIDQLTFFMNQLEDETEEDVQ